MKYLLRNKHFWMILFLDVGLLYLAYYLSYYIRFEGEIPAEHAASFERTVWLIVPFKVACFVAFGLYRGMWRYMSTPDLFNLIKATLASSGVIVLAILFFHQFQGYARSVFVIDAALTILFIGGARLIIRLFLTQGGPSSGRFPLSFLSSRESVFKRLLIIGAGDAGEKMYRELRDNPNLSYHIVGFVDDDPKKLGMRIHGVPILGNVDGLSRLVKKHEIDEILIAISSATGKEMRHIVDRCKETGIKFKTIPGIGELIDGRVSVKTIRDVSYEDLMGRKPVRMEMDKIGNYSTGEAVLITGAGGSIGSELCRQIARFDPSPLILLDCAENNLFQVEMEIARDYPQLEYIPILGNILNNSLLDNIFQAYHPRVVFHAAAYKHVPMMELNPWEAVHNNIQGTQSLLETVQRYGVERFVFVSTDKAVRPANVMGASKRVGELLAQACSREDHGRFMSVRFGNVIGSSGSVIPLFQEQIKKGGPVTVTHPEVTRFFMTIPEAAQLILQAGAMGEGGEIFILDMGIPIKIVDLASDLIRLSGFEPGQDIEIQFTGLRPGEKLYEELITEGEGIVTTHHEKILVLRGNSIQQDALLSKISELYHLSAKQDAPRIKEKLKEIVPEYQISPENSHHSPEKPLASQSETSHVLLGPPKAKGDKGTDYTDFVSP
jgi:FlaA1/EpsC-like NDP-sugar epimerase